MSSTTSDAASTSGRIAASRWLCSPIHRISSVSSPYSPMAARLPVHTSLPFRLAINPVVRGKVLAEMTRNGDAGGKKHLALVIHGDAAFSGQGVVMESLQLCALPNYSVQGAIHVVSSTQLGLVELSLFASVMRCSG